MKITSVEGKDTPNPLAFGDAHESSVSNIHRQITIRSHQFFHSPNIAALKIQEFDGPGLDHLPERILRFPGEIQKIHRCRQNWPDRPERLVDGQKQFFASRMLVIVFMYEGNQRPGIDEDYRRWRLRSTSILRNFSPLPTERSRGPPLTHPIRWATRS